MYSLNLGNYELIEFYLKSVLFWFPSLYSLKKWYNLIKDITNLFGGSNLWIKNTKTS